MTYQKPAWAGLASFVARAAATLLDFGFFEIDMLARNGVVFGDDHLFRHCTRVFLGDVEKPRAGTAEQLNF